MEQKYAPSTDKILNIASEEALYYKKHRIEPGHILLGIYEASPEKLKQQLLEWLPSEEEFRQALEKESGVGRNRLGLRKDSYVYNNESRRILFEAYEIHRGFQTDKILPEHLLLGIFSRENQVLEILDTMGYNNVMLKQKIINTLS